uniref:Chromodomain-containing protein n=1 Tax=Euplotoides octocarinatus TaxID=2716877 RepID=B6VAD9_EUPOC|nr:chromodomain-containing protein [Euplotes octocarinatus]
MNDEESKGEDKEDFFQVEKIVDMKSVKDKKSGGQRKLYLIKWVGYSTKDNTWEPIENLSNVLYMVDEFEEKRKAASKNQPSSKDGKESAKKSNKKRDLKLQDKAQEQNILDFADLNKDNDEDNAKSGQDEFAEIENVLNSDETREGQFGVDEPEKILGVVNQINSKEWEMKVRWKKSKTTGKRPRSSIHTNTTLKKICPGLLFDFYESNVISNV